jgi:hypothetical protein
MDENEVWDKLKIYFWLPIEAAKEDICLYVDKRINDVSGFLRRRKNGSPMDMESLISAAISMSSHGKVNIQPTWEACCSLQKGFLLPNIV